MVFFYFIVVENNNFSYFCFSNLDPKNDKKIENRKSKIKTLCYPKYSSKKIFIDNFCFNVTETETSFSIKNKLSRVMQNFQNSV